MTRYVEYIERKRREYGDDFDARSLDSRFIRYFDSGERIKVRTRYASGEEFIRTGTIGVTTGWRPTFLLMHRSNARGSWDTLGVREEIVAVKRGRTYEAL